jgi:hypothetical protein
MNLPKLGSLGACMRAWEIGARICNSMDSRKTKKPRVKDSMDIHT